LTYYNAPKILYSNDKSKEVRYSRVHNETSSFKLFILFIYKILDEYLKKAYSHVIVDRNFITSDEYTRLKDEYLQKFGNFSVSFNYPSHIYYERNLN